MGGNRHSTGTVGMPRNESVRGQPPPREVGGTPLNWPKGEQNPNNFKRVPRCIRPLTRGLGTTKFKGVSYSPRYGLIIDAVRIVLLSLNE